MTPPSPAQLGERLVELLGGASTGPNTSTGASIADDTSTSAADAHAGAETGVGASVSGGEAWARATVDVPASLWADAVRTVRDELGCDFFDWLSAVDELDAGFAIVTHLWSTASRYGILLRTKVARDDARVDSIIGIYPGAAWPERETHEMFDIDFIGHENLTPLLLPPEFEGHPLRKEFVLASRVAKAWPGAVEPGESHQPGVAKRAPMRPPGVPAPGEWGAADES